MLGFLLLFFIGTVHCSTEYFSNLNSLINGPLPIFDLSHFVNDTHNDVPVIVQNVTAKLDKCKTCKLDIFDGTRFTASLDNKYRRYIEDGTLPVFEDNYEAAQFLMRILQNLQFYLIDEEMMWGLDDIHVKVMEAKDLTQQVELDAYRQVFDRVDFGKSLLQHLLAFLARFVEKGTVDDGYMQVSSLLAKHIAKEFFHCSWMYRCSEFSRDVTISLVLKLGSQNIPKVVVLYPHEHGAHVHPGEGDIHPGVLEDTHHGYAQVEPHEKLLEHAEIGGPSQFLSGFEHGHELIPGNSFEDAHHLKYPLYHEHLSQIIPTFSVLHEAITRLSEQLTTLHHKHVANLEAYGEEPHEGEPNSYYTGEHDGYNRDYNYPPWHHYSGMGGHHRVHHAY